MDKTFQSHTWNGWKNYGDIVQAYTFMRHKGDESLIQNESFNETYGKVLSDTGGGEMLKSRKKK